MTTVLPTHTRVDNLLDGGLPESYLTLALCVASAEKAMKEWVKQAAGNLQDQGHQVWIGDGYHAAPIKWDSHIIIFSPAPVDNSPFESQVWDERVLWDHPCLTWVLTSRTDQFERARDNGILLGASQVRVSFEREATLTKVRLDHYFGDLRPDQWIAIPDAPIPPSIWDRLSSPSQRIE